MSVSLVEINNIISSFVQRGICKDERQAQDEIIARIEEMRFHNDLRESSKEFDNDYEKGEIVELDDKFIDDFVAEIKEEMSSDFSSL